MTNFNNYFLYFTNKQSEQWEGWQIEASSSLVVNDIIDLREQHESIRKKLIDDFNTTQFLIVKRIFIHDTFNEDTGGVFNLYLEPLSTNILNINALSYNLKEFNVFFNGIDDFLKSMRPKGYFGESPQNQEDLDQQYEMIKKLREIKDFVDKNYNKNKGTINL